MAKFPSYYGQIIFLQVCVLYFLIHLSFNKHIGCFYIIAIVNNAAIKSEVQISLRHWFHFSLQWSRSVIAGSYGSSIFNFLRNTHTVPCNYKIYILTKSVWGFHFLYIFIITWCYLFDNRNAKKLEVISHCNLYLLCSYGLWCWVSFHLSVGHLSASFGVSV